MKRIVLVLLFIIQCVCARSSGHIKFMGMDVTGNMESFKDSLVTKGFFYVESFKSSCRFHGEFANEFVTLTILASPKTQMVCKIIVEFLSKSEWKDLPVENVNRKSDDEYFGSYIHMGGKIAALTVIKGANSDVAKDVAMQAAAMKPLYTFPSEVPADVLDNEKAVLKEQAMNEGKPADIAEKMVNLNKK